MRMLIVASDCMVRRALLISFAMTVCLAVAGCGHQAGTQDGEPPTACFEFQGVKFKSGMPAHGDSLEQSLAAPAHKHIDALRFDAQVLKENPVFEMEIVGFSDDRECVGDACYELTRRRAMLVYQRLIDHGVPRQRLEAPKGLGPQMFIDTNETEEGRSRNRRVEVNVIGFGGKHDQSDSWP